MAIDSNGAHGHVPDGERLNAYALVIYIPAPLGDFLDDLRRELVPHYNPHAHVSVLPPRPLAVEWHVASQYARALTEGWAPFEVELTQIDLFKGTEVIYIGIGAGGEDLSGMHRAMNTGALEFEEPFSYHPHITLAQEVPHADIHAVYELAKCRWKEYRGPRTFRAERAAFVQNTMNNLWLDLAEYSLGEYRPVV